VKLAQRMREEPVAAGTVHTLAVLFVGVQLEGEGETPRRPGRRRRRGKAGKRGRGMERVGRGYTGRVCVKHDMHVEAWILHAYIIMSW